MSDAVTLVDVTKRFGDFVAVDHVSLAVPEGQIVGLLGPNGAGKTTTLRMILSIFYPDSGQVRVLGRDRASQVKDRIGYLPEERGLYRKMSVEQTLRYFGRLKGLRRGALESAISANLERVGLAGWRRRPIEALSKGMQQKIQFVATVLHQPELVILDEPFSGLDPLNMEVLKDLTFELKRRGATVVFSTHQMELAERMCDRIVLLSRGRKLIEGTLAEVRSRFASRMVTFEGDGALDSLAALPGVSALSVTAHRAVLELSDGVQPERLLEQAMRVARLTRYEVHQPNLHEIFVKLVGGDEAAAQAAPPAEAGK